MKTFFLSIMSGFLFFISIQAQNVTGIIIEQYGAAVPDLTLQLFVSSNVYSTTTLFDGSFIFNNITSVKKELIPSGYSVSENYPNPFNPKTRISASNGPLRCGKCHLLHLFAIIQKLPQRSGQLLAKTIVIINNRGLFIVIGTGRPVPYKKMY